MPSFTTLSGARSVLRSGAVSPLEVLAACRDRIAADGEQHRNIARPPQGPDRRAGSDDEGDPRLHVGDRCAERVDAAVAELEHDVLALHVPVPTQAFAKPVEERVGLPVRREPPDAWQGARRLPSGGRGGSGYCSQA